MRGKHDYEKVRRRWRGSEAGAGERVVGGAAPKDRQRSGDVTQKGTILEGLLAHTEMRAILDGQAMRRACAFDAETEAGEEQRLLYVPFAITENPVTALVLCRRFGLIESKLAALGDAAAYVYLTHLVAPELEN